MEKIGLVTEYFIKENNEVLFSNESREFIEYAKTKFLLYIINPSKNKTEKEFIAIDTNNNNKEVNINPQELNSIYVALVGKNISEINQTNCMADQIEEFCEFLSILEKVEEQGVKIINNTQSIIYNVGKEYLIELKEKEHLDTIETNRITSFKQLIELKRSNEDILIKPVIGERSHGVIRLREKTEEEVKEHYHKYTEIKKGTNSIYNAIMKRQGLLFQPYQKEFNKGEKKAAVVAGKFSIARSIEQSNDSSINSVHKGATRQKYIPSQKEKEFVLKAYNAFNNLYKTEVARIDYIQTEQGFLVSEIEAINPSFSTRHKGLYTKEEKEIHFNNLCKLFHSTCKSKFNHVKKQSLTRTKTIKMIQQTS